jgi:hypothetical protein
MNHLAGIFLKKKAPPLLEGAALSEEFRDLPRTGLRLV